MSGMTAIVQNLVKMNFEDIPIQTIERQKDLLIDTLGVAVAGSGAPGVAQLVEFLHDIGGKAEASIMVFGGKCPSFHAAMANSLMAHSMDFDDMHETAGIHANVCVVPAALALAERNKNISGRMLLTAVVLGVDLACRMGAAIPLHRGWHATATFGVFGALAVNWGNPANMR